MNSKLKAIVRNTVIGGNEPIKVQTMYDDKISDSVKNIKFDNEKIIEVNDLLKDLAKDEKITYVDLYNKLIDDDGNLNISYTKDGLHISSEGYECITKELMKYIKD